MFKCLALLIALFQGVVSIFVNGFHLNLDIQLYLTIGNIGFLYVCYIDILRNVFATSIFSLTLFFLFSQCREIKHGDEFHLVHKKDNSDEGKLSLYGFLFKVILIVFNSTSDLCRKPLTVFYTKLRGNNINNVAALFIFLIYTGHSTRMLTLIS